MLEDAGLVRGYRVGRDRQWQMKAQQLTAARHYLDQISAQWDAAVGRLRRYVETDDVAES